MESAPFPVYDEPQCVPAGAETLFIPHPVRRIGRKRQRSCQRAKEEGSGSREDAVYKAREGVVAGGVRHSRRAPGAGDRSSEAVCGKLGVAIGEDTAYSRAAARRESYRIGKPGLDSFLRDVVGPRIVAGGREGSESACAVPGV